MSVLVVGATGATGRLLVWELLGRGLDVRVIVRTPDRLPRGILNHHRLSVVRAGVLDLSDAEMVEHVNGRTAVASCLGHNLTLKGVFGPPRKLVADATRRLCEAIVANGAKEPTRFVLMNTTANRNRDLNEHMPFTDRCVVGLSRLLLPPQKDNEQAAEYLRTRVGKESRAIEWVAVRPESLTNEERVTPYVIHAWPVESVVSSSARTSRNNVAHFMAELMTNDDTWRRWKGQMPVIYNRGSLE